MRCIAAKTAHARALFHYRRYGREFIERSRDLSPALLSFNLQRSGTLLGFTPKQQEVAMTSLITKSLVRSGIVVASLALAGNVFAADSHAVKSVKTAPVSHTHVVTRRPVAQRPADLAQFFQGLFGGGFAVRVTGGGGSYESPAYDNSPTVDESSAASDSLAASEAEDQAIQEMNDSNAQTASMAAAEEASMAAAEEQNDAANAATLQTEINAGM
jgi:hypothetical protein